MNCKRGRETPTPLTPERIGQLSANLVRKGQLIVDAIMIGQLAFRHPEGPEKDIPDRESPGKVGIAALFKRAVMPAVEHRRRQHVFERAQRPVEIGVNKGQRKNVEGPTHSMTFGEIPASSNMTSTAMVPRNR